MADDDQATQESAHDIFLRAVALMDSSNWAEARPLFEQVMTMPDCSQKGYDSCIANVAMCAHNLGDHQTALTNIAMFLESSATPTAEQRAALLEMFFASYKGQSGIDFHNPYNEYH
jgi:hypothetical protein